MSDEEKRKAARHRRLKKYVMSLSPEDRILSKEANDSLVAEGLADENGLTEAGQLRVHQLELLKWMVDHPR